MYKFVKDKETHSVQRLSIKGDGDIRDGNITKVFESIFHFWCDNPVVVFSLPLLAHAYHVVFQLV